MKLTIAILSLFIVQTLSAQDTYTTKTSNDLIDIQAKWKYPVKKGVEQPAELLLKVVNSSDKLVSLTFDLEFSIGIQTAETFHVDTCVKAGKTMNGKLNGLYFVSGSLSNAQLKSDDFDWEINELSTAEIDTCPVDK